MSSKASVEPMQEDANDWIDLLIEKNESMWISFEFFPPKTPAGVEVLFQNVSNLNKYRPMFVDFTWGAGGSTSDLTMDLCKRAKSEYGLIPNMHLTCTGLDINQLDGVLDQCHKSGIRNILALRGDPPQGQETWVMPENGLTSALELILHIKTSKYATDFCVGAAGYPEGHPNKMIVVSANQISSLTSAEMRRMSTDFNETDGTKSYTVCKDADYECEMIYLKQKVEAGAAFIITQMFFDFDVYASFVNSCRAYGIHVPIIPGIMLIGSYAGFKKMTKMCKTRVPTYLDTTVESYRNDEAGLKDFGVKYGVQMAQKLMIFGVPGLHFYTLNSSIQTSQIVDMIDFKSGKKFAPI